MPGYAVVLGEALIDLVEQAPAGSAGAVGLEPGYRAVELEPGYRAMVGGAPLNVAVGLARLGGAVEFAGSVGDDPLGRRIVAYLDRAGVGTRQVVPVPAPTSLAVTTLEGAEPTFRFYGEPPSYGGFGPADLDEPLVAGASVLYCGSIALLRPAVLAAARRAWAVPGPLRTFDPNVRPALTLDLGRLGRLVEEFAAAADLVKLSAADAMLLYRQAPPEAAARLAGAGAHAVVVTLGADGALVRFRGQQARVPAPAVPAVDATGAGDAAMAGLLRGLLAAGPPASIAGWAELARFATAVGALTCEAPGGAGAMPTLDAVRRRFPTSTRTVDGTPG